MCLCFFLSIIFISSFRAGQSTRVEGALAAAPKRQEGATDQRARLHKDVIGPPHMKTLRCHDASGGRLEVWRISSCYQIGGVNEHLPVQDSRLCVEMGANLGSTTRATRENYFCYSSNLPTREQSNVKR